MRDAKKRYMVVAVLLASLSVGLPAAATGCGEAGMIHEAWRLDGVWQGVDGPLVVATPVAEGLSWQVLEGVELSTVWAGTFPEQVGDTVTSSAIMVPGAPSGTIPVYGDGDYRVVFDGTRPCMADPALIVHEDPAEAFVEPEPKPQVVEAVAQPAPQVRRSVPAPTMVGFYRLLTRMKFYPV
ncbi:MAG: hypothetical protein ACFCVC_06085 [Acidimicrobiia bacterium]